MFSSFPPIPYAAYSALNLPKLTAFFRKAMVCCLYVCYNEHNPPARNERNMEICIQCARTLSNDEIALTKKLINRGSTSFLCLSCLAKEFQVSEDLLREKIEQFRAMGCTLFV
jgi:hypothetical protein